MRAPAFGIRGREFESLTVHFPSNQIIYFFLVFLFHFSQFHSKTMCEYIYWKYANHWRQYRICNGKEAQLFYFSKIANTPHKGTIRHIAWLHVSSFLFKIQCFYRDETGLVPDDQHYIRVYSLCLVTFLKNDNSSYLWYTSSCNWNSSFVLIYYKSEDG